MFKDDEGMLRKIINCENVVYFHQCLQHFIVRMEMVVCDGYRAGNVNIYYGKQEAVDGGDYLPPLI